MEYSVGDRRSGESVKIFDQREDGPSAVHFRVRQQLRAHFGKKKD